MRNTEVKHWSPTDNVDARFLWEIQITAKVLTPLIPDPQ